MKSKIHPKYDQVVVTRACGESFTTRSTNPELRLEICSKCHPFFTGKQKLVDSAGRVERFQKRYRNAPVAAAGKKKGKKKGTGPEAAAPAAPVPGTANPSQG